MDAYLEALVWRDDVAFETTVKTLNAEEFEQTRSRSTAIEGGVVVAVTDEGAVLLVQNDWMDGYGFPGGGVEPGENWEAAAVREVREETGVSVEIDSPWLVERQFYEHAGQRYGPDFSAFYRATPVDDGEIGDDPGTDDEVIEDVAWFKEMPDEAVQPARIRAVLEDEIG